MHRLWREYLKYKKFYKGYYKGDKLPRKVKKFIKKAIKADWMLTKEEYRYMSLPDCKWCNGCGAYRDHSLDSGYYCPDCRGTGKQGWEFDYNGNKIEINSGLPVIEY